MSNYSVTITQKGYKSAWFLAFTSIYSSVADSDTHDIPQPNKRWLFHMWLNLTAQVEIIMLYSNSVFSLPATVLSVWFIHYLIYLIWSHTDKLYRC